MASEKDLKRFIDAHESHFQRALGEIKNGKKQSHWMWYIFPQIGGLGISETAIFYGIKDLDEATAFLKHPLLGNNLIQISEAMLRLPNNNAFSILGSPDDAKLKSCMTLFASLPSTAPVFQAVLDKFYKGEPDDKTLQLIGKPK